ncbi:MAG: hypothetical protein HYR60_08130 [Acidobacteria bacterium]|nr:hypothetical protein [Acidobacteriota bacterium]
MTLKNQAGVVQTNRPVTISRVFALGEILQFAQARVNGTPVPSQCDVKTRWPDGSLKHALVSFHASLATGASIIVDFANQVTGNNSGAMDRSAMIAANWGAQIEATNGTTLAVNARQILNDWSGTSADKRVTYWLQGPICTQVILEDRSPALAYDIGWDSYKSLHPIFVLTFYPGYPQGTKVEMILENMWTTKLQDQTYSLSLRTGNPLNSQPAYTKATFNQIAMSRWRKVFWTGTTPGRVSMDYNLAYVIHSRILPSFDLTKTTDPAALSADISRFAAGDKGDIGGTCGFWTKYMASAERPELGILPAWYLRYLYTGDPQQYDLMIGCAGVSGHVPMHYRESVTGRFFDSAKTADAFGRPLSIEARPSLYLLRPTSSNPADQTVTVGPVTTDGWDVEMAHEPDFAFVPYLVTGDWYFLEEIYFEASHNLATPNPGVCSYCRKGSVGYIGFAIQTRGQAWGMRNVAHAAVAAPDNTPEKQYFTEKLNNNIAVEEGQHNLTNGSFYSTCATNPYNASTETSLWCYGRKSIGEDRMNPLHFVNQGHVSSITSAFAPAGDPYEVAQADQMWQYGYKYIVQGHVEELGFQIGKLNNVMYEFIINMIVNPAFNPWLSENYLLPVLRKSTNNYYQSWSEVLAAYAPNLRNISGWVDHTDSNVSDPGYAHLIRAAASFLPGRVASGFKGDDAWAWLNQNVGYQSLLGINQSYALVPRVPVVVNPPLSKCDINSDGLVDARDVQLVINQALGAASCTADLDQNGRCDVIDVQRVVNASVGGSCRVGP